MPVAKGFCAWLLLAGTAAAGPLTDRSSAADAAAKPPSAADAAALAETRTIAEQRLRQTFTNLSFEDFGPAPVKGPLYQAMAGGRILYFAPESGHLLFGAIYDAAGVNVTAQAQESRIASRLAAIDPTKALIIGPDDAPPVIEFTDPLCPYCQALERYWAAKAAEGKSVRRLIYFVSTIHGGAAAKAEHILCSPDPVAAFKAIYSGAEPAKLLTCKAGADKVADDARTVAALGVSGTPTMVIAGKLVAGFQQGELEAFLAAHEGGGHGAK